MVMLSAQFHQLVEPYANEFRSARPFRHVLMEPFFAAETAEQLLHEFPAFDPRRARNEAGEIGLKAVVERIQALGGAFTALDQLIQQPAFLAQLSQITGIPDLLYDPHYFGGGTHQNLSGQDLDLHIDFNLHPVTGWHRRLNLIVYLNPQWEESWGGSLELFADPRDPASEKRCVLPLFNRAVMFETTEHSWHGFSRIHLPAAQANLSRRSIALYFYTQQRPAAETGPKHSTIYVDRPLPEWVQQAHVLSAVDVQELQIAFSRRDQHNQRLYQDIEQLQARLDDAVALLKRSWLERLAWYVRRVLRRR
jgi:hypothetical protein